MLFVIAYIVACFLVALGVKGRVARHLPWILLGSCGLLSVAYLATEPTFLSGLSISSLSVGETQVSGHRDYSTGPGRWADAAGPRGTWWRELAAWVGAALFVAGAAAIVAQPRCGVYLMVFGALAGDDMLMPGYPFAKGFSSHESVFFVHDALLVSPLEVYLVLTVISWAARQGKPAPSGPYVGPLFWPAMVFLAFVVLGFGHGVASGGDLRVALREARPVSYLVALILVTSTLIETASQVSRLAWTAMAAVLAKGATASLYYLLVLRGDVRGILTISEHGAAIHLNTLFVFCLAVWMYRASLPKRIGFPLMIPAVVLGYIALQRRAGFVTLAIAIGLAVAVLYRDQRRLFWRFVPALALVGVGYVALGWNGQGLGAVPAQAIKSVVTAEKASPKTQDSNNYRILENRNINFTIHRHPVTGIGFGQKYFVVAPMPDIRREFEWSEYITHNSIFWMWMKAGIGGFIATLFLFGLAVSVGVRALRHLPGDDLSAAILVATLYTVMHVIYGCVDMSWDPRSMVYLGAMLGVVDRMAPDGTA